MRCVEFVFNGKRMAVAGGETIRSIDHRLFYFPITGSGSFTVAGYANGDPEGLDRLFWGHADLQVGDELTVRIVESESPDDGERRSDWETPLLETDAYPTCSFCGKTNEEPQIFMVTKTAAICGECVAKAARIVNEVPKLLGGSEGP